MQQRNLRPRVQSRMWRAVCALADAPISVPCLVIAIMMACPPASIAANETRIEIVRFDALKAEYMCARNEYIWICYFCSLKLFIPIYLRANFPFIFAFSLNSVNWKRNNNNEICNRSRLSARTHIEQVQRRAKDARVAVYTHVKQSNCSWKKVSIVNQRQDAQTQTHTYGPNTC